MPPTTPPRSSTRLTAASDNPPSTCTICFDPLFLPSSSPATETTREQPVTIVKCGHIFGLNCLTQWMQEANTCPICRVEFFANEEEVPDWLKNAYVGSVFWRPTLEERMEALMRGADAG
ncbi:hypothetical protein BU26DRAFT_325217 [Trematosphaeria pertusa]|uniref:RING-type domain-containing protein n=1 Tax=Trematosphaeria pertusa TaxID=390896 RepID=A0A6A6IC70_9PLEO|nr:uncharacterized protein BU26DRAFT_325217 [Trematosphaeria pertusa]KAF2247981.1 hypothetical protein BU26DRAFT_325217 [Trematosphaeria pertusa]